MPLKLLDLQNENDDCVCEAEQLGTDRFDVIDVYRFVCVYVCNVWSR